jgi:hypothetical protein
MAAKTPAPPSPIEPGTVFVKNPAGAIHDMNETDERTLAIVALAKKSKDDWSLASDEEIAAYCELHNIIPPGKKAKAEKAEEPEEPRQATAAEERLATATADAEPVKRGPGRPRNS